MGQLKVILSNDQKFQQRMFVIKTALQQGTQQASVRYGISERTIRSWKARYKLNGLDGLKDKSRKAHHIRNKKDEDGVLKTALLNLHDLEPGLNRFQVLGKLMCEKTKDLPTISWIARTRKKYGLTQKNKRKKTTHKKRYEIAMPGALQVDTKYVQKENGEYMYQFTAIDECSRVRFMGASMFKGAEGARKFLVRALEFYENIGVKVWRVQTDNGTEFTLPKNDFTQRAYIEGEALEHVFTAECNERGIKHRLIKPRSPELNGKVERSHRIDNERFYSKWKFNTEYELEHALQKIWIPEYNEQRPHGALGYKTPMEFLKQRIKHIENAEFEKIKQIDEERLAA